MGKKTGPKTEAGLQAVSANAGTLDHAAWTKNPKAVEAIEKAKRLRKTKHGLYSSVPIICKAEGCPYAHNCPLLQEDPEQVPYGEKCPLEIAAIEDLFQRYAEEMMIDPNDRRNTVDLMLIKDLVDADITLLRCDNKMAWDADYVINNVVGVNDEGEAITKQELHPLTELKEKIINRKNKTLNLLNSTRKDKAGDKLHVMLDPSERAAEMVRVQQDMDVNLDSEEEAKRQYYERMKRNNSDAGGNVIDVEPINMEDEEE